MGKKRKHQQKNNDEAIIETSETDSNFSPSKKQKHDECLGIYSIQYLSCFESNKIIYK